MKRSWLIDTNVLIYSYDQTCKFHDPSYSFLGHGISGELNLYISHQNLLEFLAVVINPKRVQHPLSINEAYQKIVIYETSFSLICPLPETFITFTGLVNRYQTFRQRIFDMYLVATALDNGIQQICTWNIKDFQKIDEIIARTPEEIIKSL